MTFLYNVLTLLFAILCFAMGFIILLQKGKSSMGLGSMGGGTQLLFGGSGGQDLFQKATWVMGALFMGGSLLLALMQRPAESSAIASLAQQQTQAPATAPSLPTQ